MIKKQLAEQLADAMSKKGVHLTNMQSEAAIDALTGLICDNLAKGQEVTIRGFGTFGYKRRKDKMARNIKAGTFLKVPAHHKPFLKFCDKVTERVKVGMAGHPQ